MKIKRNTENQLAIGLLIVGTILMFATPLLFPILSVKNLKNVGEIGSAFWDIAAPVAQLVGIILLFLALRERRTANNIVQMQVEASERREMQERTVKHLHELYTILENNISNFSYQSNFDSNSEIKVLRGKRAIRCFINDIEEMNIDLHDNNLLLQKDGVREILSILRIAEHIFEKIKEANIEEADRNFYLNIMKHELIFSIFPYTDLDESANLKLEICEDCHELHGNYPPLIFDKMQELKRHFLKEERSAE
ncbi:hypothetical protein [Flavobacterium macacae]|uniref:Phage abortive infection protein n=1 Tax=Flavobacterium macacae TaxID=2488993 RepID=A0A3P3W9X1_9FLAO|nr:hypothetical protein [Flavobacterium macacae]RRJ90806.1 hypothetical protein EG849_10060 [Flavobacterium macacae]